MGGEPNPLSRRAWNYARSPGGSSLLGALGVLIVLLPIWWQAGRWYRGQLMMEARAQIASETSLRGNALTLAINRRFAQLQGLYAFVQAEAQDGQFEIHFETFAAGLYAGSGSIRNLAVAPGGVVRHVFPLHGNEEVLGYEPLADPRPDIRADTERAVASGRIVVSGPSQLIQGGPGLIARQAVYQDGDYWGLVNVVLDLPALLAEAGLEVGADRLDFALRDDTGRVFYGPAPIFEQDPVIHRVELPEGAWELAGLPRGGWPAAGREPLLIFQTAGLVIVGLLTGLAYLSINRQTRLALAVQQRTQEIARVNAQLEHRVAERTRELAALYDVTAVSSASLELDTVLERSLDRVLEVMGCEVGAIHLLDAAAGVLCLTARRGVPPGLVREVEILAPGSGLAGWVLQHGAPLATSDMAGDPRSLPGVGAAHVPGFYAYIGAPMRAKGRVLGVLSVVGETGRHFTAEEVALLASIADQVGGAVENARLYEQAEALAVAEERQRLAREIHDTLAQGLTGITIQLEAIESGLEQGQKEVALKRLCRARDLANYSLAEARRSVWALRSKALEEKRFAAALRDSVHALTAETGLEVAVETQNDLPQLPVELQTDLLRVAQEAVMNVVKHARARRLAIQLDFEAGTLELRIRDDGRGFRPAGAHAGAQTGGGFGLTAMRERMARHGGALRIESHPPHGSLIVASVELIDRRA